MNNLDTERIAAQLQHFTHEETIALVCVFLAELSQEQQARFLSMVKQGPPLSCLA